MLGRTVEEMMQGMTQRAFVNWQRYWQEEPWGPWRDNMHTAILARELRRPQLKPWAANTLEDFMLRAPRARRADKKSAMLGLLRTIGRTDIKTRKRKVKRHD